MADSADLTSKQPTIQTEPAVPVDVTVHHPPVTPGKVAMWLFLGTEIMFFTGLIGTYIVLRAGSPPAAFSNTFAPATNVRSFPDEMVNLTVDSVGNNTSAVQKVLDATKPVARTGEKAARGLRLTVGKADAPQLLSQLEAAGAKVKESEVRFANWPKPYDKDMNPLSIDLTAINTFILICSSVTMVLALNAIQKGNKKWLCIYLLATVLIGSTFLSIQVFEYHELMFGRHYPVGISANGHFRPHVSLFASCFFTMTGFHGAHVTGGVILLSCILIQALLGTYTPTHYSSVELAGLYWHFVDLVWIILFTVVYLI